jgi:broad specificity phosphatase PhoE
LEQGVTRILMVRHAPTAASARRAFPADEPIEALETLDHVTVPSGLRALSSPALRCRQTAALLDLRPTIEPRLAECDFGRWAGLTLDELEPHARAAWMADPASAPHGGESLSDFSARVAGWLEEQRSPVIAVTHGGVIRAAVMHARGGSFWDVDPAPLSITELRRADEGWAVM